MGGALKAVLLGGKEMNVLRILAKETSVPSRQMLKCLCFSAARLHWLGRVTLGSCELGGLMGLVLTCRPMGGGAYTR